MHPYRIAGIVLGAIALFFLVILGVGLFLPGTWEAEGSGLLEAPPERVFPYLSGAERWGLWTPYPEEGVELFGPAEGPGSGRRWDDPAEGSGEFTITRVRPFEEVAYGVEVEDGAIRIEGHIRLERENGHTRIHWREKGDFGWNPLLGYVAGRMAELQGARLEAALEALGRVVSEAEEGEPEGPNPPD